MKKTIKRKPNWKNICIAAIALYLLLGMLQSAYYSHIDPEWHKACVVNEICIK